VRILEGYGLSETSPVATFNHIERESKPGTVGQPILGVDVMCVSDDGTPVPAGERGEVVIRGPNIMKGYFRQPEATAEALRGGWFHTGDMAKMDEKGFFYIVDRKKDMILVSGFNVYPNEVEDVIAMLPGVLEVGAVGVPDEKSGEAVKVVIVRKDPNLTAEEVKAHARENLTGYKQPKYVEFRTELPKTNVGKILRRELRDPTPAKP